MAIVRVKSDHFLAERGKLVALRSRLLVSAADFMEAALWLIGGNQFGQALVLLHNAIEVALKADLERIHKILIASPRELEKFDTLKSLLKKEFRKHPSGPHPEIQDFDIERTIYFEEAFDRVADLYPGLRAKWRDRLVPAKRGGKDSLHDLRNKIVHYGDDSKAKGQYVEAIVDVALPFLEDLFAQITSRNVSVPLLLKEWVYREVGVAQKVLMDLRSQNQPVAAYAMKPLSHHVLWNHAQWPSPFDDLDVITHGGETEWESYVVRQTRQLFKTWDETLTIEIDCPICDSDTADQSYVKAQVLLESKPLDNNVLLPEAFNCFVCDFYISPKERFLARNFVGEIPTDVSNDYLRDIGQSEQKTAAPDETGSAD